MLNMKIKSLLGAITMVCSLYTQAQEPPPYKDMVGKRLSSLECAAVNLYHESRGESDVANMNIMGVVFNRVDSDEYPNSICKVVFQNKQFSWTHDKKSDTILDLKQYDRLYNIVVMSVINRSMVVSLTEGADHYHTVKVNPSWSRSRRMQYLARIDNQLFYKRNKL